MKELSEQKKFRYKWLSIAFAIKGALFAFFAYNFYHYWPKEMITNVIFNASGDTSGYYAPLESLVQGKGYYSMGRMPGLLPIYVPLRLLFSVEWTQAIIIILQFLTGVISVYALSKTALLIFKKERIFYITFFLYAFSSFVSIWDHVGYSDSFAISFLIFSFYFLIKYKETLNWKHLFFSGFFIAWSVFFRPIHGLAVPLAFLFFLFDIRNIIQTIKRGIIYSLVLIITLSMWTYKNYRDFNKIVVLQGSMIECFPRMITQELLSIRELITVWGGDTQPWSKGSDAEWLLTKKTDEDKTEPESKNIYTSAYNIDSLRILKKKYFASINDTISEAERNALKKYVNTKSLIYLESYKKEHFFRYLLVNRLIITKRLLVPPRLDDLPFPPLAKMSIIHKVAKGGYFLLLIFVNIVGVIGCFLALRKRKFLAIIPLAFIFTLTFIFGYVEQRYLLPAYCFLVIFVAYVIDSLIEYYNRRKNKIQ